MESFHRYDPAGLPQPKIINQWTRIEFSTSWELVNFSGCEGNPLRYMKSDSLRHNAYGRPKLEISVSVFFSVFSNSPFQEGVGLSFDREPASFDFAKVRYFFPFFMALGIYAERNETHQMAMLWFHPGGSCFLIGVAGKMFCM
jgi:hypothetical protein